MKIFYEYLRHLVLFWILCFSQLYLVSQCLVSYSLYNCLIPIYVTIFIYGIIYRYLDIEFSTFYFNFIFILRPLTNQLDNIFYPLSFLPQSTHSRYWFGGSLFQGLNVVLHMEKHRYILQGMFYCWFCDIKQKYITIQPCFVPTQLFFCLNAWISNIQWPFWLAIMLLLLFYISDFSPLPLQHIFTPPFESHFSVFFFFPLCFLNILFFFMIACLLCIFLSCYLLDNIWRYTDFFTPRLFSSPSCCYWLFVSICVLRLWYISFMIITNNLIITYNSLLPHTVPWYPFTLFFSTFHCSNRIYNILFDVIISYYL